MKPGPVISVEEQTSKKCFHKILSALLLICKVSLTYTPKGYKVTPYHFHFNRLGPSKQMIYVTYYPSLFGQNCFWLYNLSCDTRKTVLGVPDLVRHKSACTVTEAGYKLAISDLRRRGIVLCSESKGADQLCSYCTADLRLCFRIGKNPVFT